MLEIVTRERVEVIDSGAVVIDGGAPPAPPHVRIRVESTGWMDEDDLVALVRRELPVSVTFELWLGDRALWPEPEPAPFDASAPPAGTIESLIRPSEPDPGEVVVSVCALGCALRSPA